MAAEWEPHAATWLAWPHNRRTWPDKFEPIPDVWADLVRALAPYERVNILAGGEAVMAEAQRLVGHVPGVTLHDIRTNDAWARDHGPTFLSSDADLPPALVDWEYNAWGGKYPPYDDDNRVPQQIAALQGRQRFAPGIVMEGGAIDVNGRGTLLTTEQCLLNTNRNPQLSRAEVERCLADYLGVRHFIWLSEGIAGDDTDGHIDELARFLGPTTVVAALESDPDDENYAALRTNFDRLSEARDQDGRQLEVIALPMPRAIYHQGQRLPASYANFYLANGVAIVPQFDDPSDAVAIEVLKRLLPDRRVLGLRARDLVWGLGAFHCITQQEPLARLAPI
jgi:agmatine deiminase